MNAEIVTTGTELLLGEIVDTNATFIARQLREVGVNMYYKTTVGDNRQRLAEVLRHGLQRSDLIIVTGGLGPTVDDITREAVADATGQPLEQRPEIVEHLQAQFASWGRTLTENNLRQTFLPATAEIIPNPIGTAPGFLIETETSAIICMPGVPREMKRMMADWVLPFLQERMSGDRMIISARILHTAGIGESAIDDRIADLMTVGNPTIGLAAHLGRVDIRLAAQAATPEEAQVMLADLEAEVRQRLAPWIYGVDDDTLASVIAELLRQRRATLALAETNTQGRIAASFSEADREGVLIAVLTADNPLSLSLQLGADQALTLDQESARLAAGLLQAQSGADYALVVLGTMAEDQGFWSVDRGDTWLALATPVDMITKHFPVGGADEFSGSWLTINSLNFLRKRLISI
ncbi:MAG TPA: CinA family nicotinamide mononucleotide deamidase-related protein [Caldilineae bacterium]|nr:CinA family nicotinamide mononucleotide deamidase-related protein [Caldilineae bacterium]